MMIHHILLMPWLTPIPDLKSKILLVESFPDIKLFFFPRSGPSAIKAMGFVQALLGGQTENGTLDKDKQVQLKKHAFY